MSTDSLVASKHITRILRGITVLNVHNTCDRRLSMELSNHAARATFKLQDNYVCRSKLDCCLEPNQWACQVL